MSVTDRRLHRPKDRELLYRFHKELNRKENPHDLVARALSWIAG